MGQDSQLEFYSHKEYVLVTADDMRRVKRRRPDEILLALRQPYLFQCCWVLYKAGNMSGRTMPTLSEIRLRMYSLFQKYKARSATCTRNRDKSMRRREKGIKRSTQ